MLTPQQKDQMRVAELRSALGLPQIEYKERLCLKCEKKFESESTSNRVCYKCKKSRVKVYPEEY